jgi:hypothetical protein
MEPQSAHTQRASVSPSGMRRASAAEPQWLQNFTER